MKKAIFLDRDGVINPLIINPSTQEYESPCYPVDFGVYPYVAKSIKMLKDAGYKIIIISNQPSYAKGKISLENMHEIERILHDFSDDSGGLIDDFYYCYHHPDGIVPELSIPCRCRKPGTLFLEDAVKKHDLCISECFFIGDCDTDIECGKAMGCKTVKVNNVRSMYKSGDAVADFYASNLLDATLQVLNNQ